MVIDILQLYRVLTYYHVLTYTSLRGTPAPTSDGDGNLSPTLSSFDGVEGGYRYAGYSSQLYTAVQLQYICHLAHVVHTVPWKRAQQAPLLASTVTTEG